MAPIKYATFSNLVNVAATRLETMKENVQAMQNVSPLTPTQIQKLHAYIMEATKKQQAYQGNLERVLEVITDEEMAKPQFIKEQNIVMELTTDIISMARGLLPPDVPPSPSTHSDVSIASPLSHATAQVSLPRLSLKHFDGNPAQWLSFINLFDTAVHRNAGLTNILKLQYLLTHVSGEPLNMIKSLDLTAENYVSAYQILRDRYHNPRRLQALHLNAVLDLPKITAGDSKGIRAFLNLYAEHSQALKGLNSDITSDSNVLLAALLLRRLDTVLSRNLEAFRANKQEAVHTLPQHSTIIDFLELECTIAEDSCLNSPLQSFSKRITSAPKTKQGSRSSPVAMVATSDTTQISDAATSSLRPCFVCLQTTHKIYTCPKFQDLKINERFKLVRDNNRCTCCLGAHSRSACKSLNVCQKCRKRHHTLLHFPHKDDTLSPVEAHTQSHSAERGHVSMTSQAPLQHSLQGSTTVLLGTTLIQLTATNGRTQVFRSLLDSGSTSHFISERAAKILGGPRLHANLQITGIAHSSTHTRGRVDLNIKSLSGKLLASSQPMFILDKISVTLPRACLLPEVFARAQSYLLADPSFHLPGAIDVIVGASLVPQLMTNESYSLGPNMPHVIGTQLGFIVMGEAPCTPPVSPTLKCDHATTLLAVNELDLHSSLQRFWTQEEPPIHTQKSEEEILCDEHFAATHTRDAHGRYTVSLPFRKDAPALGDSRLAAERRFRSLEHKFKSQPHFKTLYTQFMEEYCSLGHMIKLSSFDSNLPHYFFPHHGVLKESSSTTKLRTVFDASCKTSNGLSLNDILLQGPKLQTNICDLILQFRVHNVVFVCDVRQMFRQIRVDPASQRFQCIVWRSSPEDELSVYQLTTVTYGVKSSPYLAIRTLHQLAEDEGHDFPDAARVLKEQTYVDDVLGGGETLEEAKALQAQLIDLLARGGFELRKWFSNEPQLLEQLPSTHLETPGFLCSSELPHFSILGLQWTPTSDNFIYQISMPQESCTKRQILSCVAKIYDPCGFLAPITMWCKCLMQLLWTLGLGWDDVIPAELLTKWQTFVSQLPLIEQIQIPRRLLLSQALSVQLHGFSDGSEAGYAAVVYLRCELPDGSIIIRQLIAKTRVAPLKKMTVPRLELCAAHLLSQLVSYCKTVLSHVPITAHYLWCDSRVALTWLQTPSYQLKTYVANRVAQTQALVPSHWWHYVKSEDNAADCASRGVLPAHLQDLDSWWNGPSWLQDSADKWPINEFRAIDLASTSEVKDVPLTVLVAAPQEEWDLLLRFSSWDKLQRVTAYVLRFLNNARRKSTKRLGSLTVDELNSSRLCLIRLVQKNSFAQDISALKRQHSPSFKLQRLSPFLDSGGLLRVGGRLSKSQLPWDAKHPLLLPKKHHVVDLLIIHYHVCHLHAGAQLTQALISQRYWILSARSKIRSVIYRCLRCFRLKPRTTSPMMADLPAPRVTPAKCFLSTGMDYAGPFTIKTHQLRGIKHLKSYLCIFVCLSTKAVHLEVVTDLTSQAFIAALTRFTCRRGKCTDLFSDCGTNFLGADASLKKTFSRFFSSFSQEISRQVMALEINFHFNPAAAPHFGGLWESAVKSAKHHLRRAIGDQVLTLPEFETLVTQVEAILNSRPLTPLTADPNDLQALTPGHFLTGAPLVSVPEDELHHVPSNRLKHFQLVQAMHQRIWRRWQMEYLHTLNQRSKWTSEAQDLKVGDMVLVHTPTPPLSWPLGRITQVFPGSDNIVRVVEVKTATGSLRRPVVKVSPLPLRD